MTPLVVLDHVVRRFVARAETVVAVDGVSLSVAPGELVGIAGPSGSGKTTLLDLVLGFERPDEGSVTFDASIRERAGWSGVAAVPQELGLLPELTGGQNVELAARLAQSVRDASADASDRATWAVGALGLEPLVTRLPSELSLGEQQRFAVARAVAAGPLLLVADEPTSHQDEGNADRVMELLRAVTASGGAVLVASHDDRVLDRAHRIISLRDGHLVSTVG